MSLPTSTYIKASALGYVSYKLSSVEALHERKSHSRSARREKPVGVSYLYNSYAGIYNIWCNVLSRWFTTDYLCVVIAGNNINLRS
jgi:hypothetical protein